MSRAVMRYGLSFAALLPFSVCLILFTDLPFWQSMTTFAAVGVYAGASVVIDRRYG